MKRWSGEGLSWMVTAAAALACTVAVFLAVAQFTPKSSYVHVLFLERSWIQHVTTFFFFFTVSTLAFRHGAHRKECRALNATKKSVEGLNEKDLGSTLIYSDARRLQEEVLDAELAEYRESRTLRRIRNALDRLRKTQSTSELDDYFRTRSDIDYGELDASYAVIQYLIWLIPTLGFVGTVMGIGTGIAGFSDVITHAKDFGAIQGALPAVTSALGTAFDTTFLALAFSIVAVWYSAFLRKQQEQLLGEMDNLCLDGIVALFREHSRDTEAVVGAVGQNVGDLRNVMNGNRAAIEALINAVTRTLQDILRFLTDVSQRQDKQDIILQQMGALRNDLGRDLAANMAELRRGQEALEEKAAQSPRRTEELLEALAATLRETNRLLSRTLPPPGRDPDQRPGDPPDSPFRRL